MKLPIPILFAVIYKIFVLLISLLYHHLKKGHLIQRLNKVRKKWTNFKIFFLLTRKTNMNIIYCNIAL